MIEINGKLPEWIERQASLGPNVKVDGEETEENAFWYLLTVSCPLIFESYAIVLHPFGINWEVKELADAGQTIIEEQVDEADFKRLSWKQFLSIYGYDFELKTANSVFEQIQLKLSKKGWPVYVWFPAEGNCETDALQFIISQIAEIYGDIYVNYFYCFLMKRNWENEDSIFRGTLSEFGELKLNPELRGNPTAIFPDDRQWCILSDYDLPFSYVGGNRELIEKITRGNQFDIYQIEPKFKEKID